MVRVKSAVALAPRTMTSGGMVLVAGVSWGGGGGAFFAGAFFAGAFFFADAFFAAAFFFAGVFLVFAIANEFLCGIKIRSNWELATGKNTVFMEYLAMCIYAG